MKTKILAAVLVVLSANAMAQGVGATGTNHTAVSTSQQATVMTSLVTTKINGALAYGYVVPSATASSFFFVGFTPAGSATLNVWPLTAAQAEGVKPAATAVMFGDAAAPVQLGFTSGTLPPGVVANVEAGYMFSLAGNMWFCAVDGEEVVQLTTPQAQAFVAKKG